MRRVQFRWRGLRPVGQEKSAFRIEIAAAQMRRIQMLRDRVRRSAGMLRRTQLRALRCRFTHRTIARDRRSLEIPPVLQSLRPNQRRKRVAEVCFADHAEGNTYRHFSIMR